MTNNQVSDTRSTQKWCPFSLGYIPIFGKHYDVIKIGEHMVNYPDDVSARGVCNHFKK